MYVYFTYTYATGIPIKVTTQSSTFDKQYSITEVVHTL